MKMQRNQALKSGEKGISLIIVLILTVIIGFTAAAAMRSATSSQRVTNNVRMDNIAQQFAEASLRYCEAQLQIPDDNVSPNPVRVNSLKTSVIPVVDMTVPPPKPNGAWEDPVSWTGAIGAGGAASTRTALPSSQYIATGLSSYLPAKPPECVAEVQKLPGSPSFTVTVVTARGFSTDYRADSTGKTLGGSVVWLQSILNLEP